MIKTTLPPLLEEPVCFSSAYVSAASIMGSFNANGESIYGTVRNPLVERPEWGDCSGSKDGKALYLHVLDWPKSGTITVNDMSATATSATYLANGQRADITQISNTLKIELPSAPLDKYDTVIKLTF